MRRGDSVAALSTGGQESPTGRQESSRGDRSALPPAWRPRPPDAFPILDGLLCSIPATDLIQCPALISLLRYKWTSEGWQDPLGGPVIDPWQEEDYAAFDDEDCSVWDFAHA